MQLLCIQYPTKTRWKANLVLHSPGPKIQKYQSLTSVVTIISLLGVYSYCAFHLIPVLLVNRVVLSVIFPLLLLFHIIFPLLHGLPQALLGAFSVKALLRS